MASNLRIWLAGLVLLVFGSISLAQTDTAFTYQGHLQSAGQPVDADADFRFRLYDALVGGNQIGAEVVVSAAEVNVGLFDAVLDFGANALGGRRWLEIDVRSPHDPSDTEPFATLSPRQSLTASPFSVQTRGIFIGDDGNITFDSMNAADGTVTMTSIGGIDLIIDADTNNIGEDQNARIVMRQDGGQVIARMGYREAANSLEIMQEWPSNLILGTSNQDRVTITSNGFVGIGTSTPAAELNVVGDGSGTLVKLTNGASGAGTGLAITDVANGGRAASFYGVTSNDVLRVQNDGTGNAATFAGKVGIGTSAAFGALHVETSAAPVMVYAFNPSTVDNLSGVIGTSSSTFGGVGVWGRSVSSTGVGYGVIGESLSSNGFDFYAAGAGQNYGSSSSRRWKNNIQNIDDPLDKIARLRGVYFDWDKEHGGQHDVGMIAEEVGQVLSEIVNYEPNGVDAIGLDYSKMTPLLVEAFNALRAEKDSQITTLKDEVGMLRNTNNTLQTRNDMIESRLAILETIVAQLAASQETKP